VLQSIFIYDTPTAARDIEAYRATIHPAANPYPEIVRWAETSSVFLGDFLDRIALHDAATLSSAKAMRFVPDQNAFEFIVTYGSERKTQRGVLNKIKSLARLGKCEALDQILREHQYGPAWATTRWLNWFQIMPETIVRGADKQLCANVALSTLFFRATNQRDPKTMDELVPKYLESVPVDWFTHQPIRLLTDNTEIELDEEDSVAGLKLRPGSLRIYTYGQNGRDEQGHGDSIEQRADRSDPRDDEVFFLPPIKKQVESKAP